MLLIFSVSCYCFPWLWFDACNQTVRFYPIHLRFKECACFSSAMFSMSRAVHGVFFKAQIARQARVSIQRQHSAFSLFFYVAGFLWRPLAKRRWGTQADSVNISMSKAPRINKGFFLSLFFPLILYLALSCNISTLRPWPSPASTSTIQTFPSFVHVHCGPQSR